MSALSAVEGEGLGVFLGNLVGCVGSGILDAAGLAVLASEDAMEGVDKKGRGGRKQDPAVFCRKCDGHRVKIRWDEHGIEFV